MASDEWEYIKNSNYRVITYFDKEIRNRQFEGQTWKHIAEEIVSKLPQKVYISFDIDGLDRKLCPLPAHRYQADLNWSRCFIFSANCWKAARTIVGFDLNEVGIGGIPTGMPMWAQGYCSSCVIYW